jgi:hypothetical protein
LSVIVSDMTPEEIAARRRKAVKTALLLAGVAVLVFVGFILSGVLRA